MLQDESSLVVNCPSCGAQLSAPRSAAGRKARCKMCDHRFIIPETGELLEDTISGWIVQDIEDLYETQDRVNEQRIQKEKAKATSSKPKQRSRKRQIDMQADESEVSGETIMAVPVVAPPTPRPTTPIRKPSAADDSESRYPSRLTVSRSQTPHLVVARCDTAGVRLRFDGKWLEHDGFRASMPVRCVFSGTADRSKLIARPVLFLDRCQDRKASVEQVTARHENRVLGDASPRELMRKMGVVARMMPPFHYAMPYYVSTKYAHLTLHTQSTDRKDGGKTCDMVIPDGVTALDWLARVNGVCGAEYEMLERDVSMLHGEAWRELSEDCRQRIAVWCKLQPREVFQLYVSDSDFGRRDEGLAGIVVTDQRLVYCKYHHRGQVRLDDEDARIVVRSDGRFATLSLIAGSERSRMVKIIQTDVAKLSQTLTNASLGIDEDE